MMHIMKQVSFQIWNIHGARDEETDTKLVMFCVEALLHVSGYVNFQDVIHLQKIPSAITSL